MAVNEEFRIYNGTSVEEYPLTPISDIKEGGVVTDVMRLGGQNGTVGLPMTDDGTSVLDDDPVRIEMPVGTSTPLQRVWANGYVVDDFADTGTITDGNRPDFFEIYPQADGRTEQGSVLFPPAPESRLTRPQWSNEFNTSNSNPGYLVITSGSATLPYSPAGQVLRYGYRHVGTPTTGYWRTRVTNDQNDTLRIENNLDDDRVYISNPFDGSTNSTTGAFSNTGELTLSLIDDRDSERVLLYEGGNFVVSNSDSGSPYGEFSSQTPLELEFVVNSSLDTNVEYTFTYSCEF